MEKTKKKNKKIINMIFVIIFVLILIIVISKLKQKKEYTDVYNIVISNQNITSQLEEDIVNQNDIIYMSFNDIKNSIDNNIYFEEQTNTIITSGEKKVMALELNNSNVEINGSEIEINGQAFKTEDGIIYLPISELCDVYDWEFTIIEDTKNIVIDYYDDKLEKAYVTKNINIRKEPKIFSEKLKKIEKGNWIIFISEENNWAKIRTQDGEIGYIKKKYLTNFVTERDNMILNLEDNYNDYLEEDITKKDLSLYENRIKIIEDSLVDAVLEQYKCIKFIYNDDLQNEGYARFKIESVPIFKECGINVEF